MQLHQLAPWIRRTLTIGLLLIGLGLWARHLQDVDWHAMRQAIGDMPHEALMWALAFTAASYLVYSSIDLLARRVTRHRLGAWRTLIIGFVSHACALNLGPAGAGFRFRLYMKHGIDAPKAAAIWLFNIATNWIGFVLLAGAAFATQWMRLPPSWGAVADASPFIGVLLLVAVAGCLVACAMAHERSWRVLGRELSLPTLGVAMLQCMVSVLNWSLLAWVLTMLLQHKVAFPTVLGALMASALALAIVDVPAGLGVIETVFLAMLGSQIPAQDILVAMLAYRAIYFLAPLAVALLVYAVLEFDAVGDFVRGASRSAFNATGRSRRERFLAPPPDAPALRPRRSSSAARRSPP